MAGKEKKVELTPVEPVVELTPEAQTKTYTQQELDVLVARAKQEEEDKYKGFQRVVSAREKEIETLKQKVAQPSRASKATEVILEELKARQAEEGIVNPRIAQLEAEIAREKQLEWQTQVTQQYEARFNQRIKDAGLDPNDETLEDFRDALEDAKEDGRFGKAERKLDKILTTIKPPEPKEKVTETEEDKFSKRLEEAKRQWMEEQGLLKTETGGPSASSGKVILMEDIKGMSPDEYRKAFPTLEDFYKAMNEGRIK